MEWGWEKLEWVWEELEWGERKLSRVGAIRFGVGGSGVGVP